MKTLKSIKTEKKYTNNELLGILKNDDFFGNIPKIVGRKRAERIIFPNTQDRGYVVAAKCSKKISVYLDTYVPPTSKRTIYDSYYSDITYWGDTHVRKNIYGEIEQIANEIKRILNIEQL